MRVVPLVFLVAVGGNDGVGVAAMEAADVRVPRGVFEGAVGGEVHALTAVGHEHFVGIVLVVVGVRKGAVEAAGGLAEVDAVGVGLDQTDVGGGDDGGTIAAALGVEDAPGDAAGVEVFDGLAIDGAALFMVPEAIRRLTVGVAAAEAAAGHGGPAVVIASVADEGEVLLAPGSIGDSNGKVGFFGGLNRGELDAAADVEVSAFGGKPRAVGGGDVLDDEVLGHGGGLPETSCGVGDGDAVIGDTE